mmetsp:Transcript_15234/g.20517  ORF Transcript_15234/g.20517 Transcript_15234/m.20517 type:complete len:304 (+) Transcript_15234:3-914(+)
MTLKGADGARGNAGSKDISTFKLSSGGHHASGHGSGIDTGWDATMRTPAAVETIWEDEREPAAEGRIGTVFDEEARSRDQQRDLVEALHKDQMKRLDEIGLDINSSIAELTVYMDGFIQSSRGLLEGTFDGLHGDLRGRIDGLLPRLRQLETMGQAVRAGLEEERASRLRETTEVLEPLREQIDKLAAELHREQKVRETRNAEIQSKMDGAVAALDAAMDTESSSREQRVTETLKEWQHEQAHLSRRQDKLEQDIQTLKDDISKETSLEKDQRMGAQDPIVEALTCFIQKFQANAQEQSHLGN